MNPYEIDIVHKALNTIRSVDPGSIGEELEIEAGDRLIAINDNEVRDVIDYRYESANEYITLTIEKKDGELILYDIEKDVEEPIGLNFVTPLLDTQKTCSNRCLFCFIDQMPPNMRDSLYIKDDDSRLSFLQGNYITLTNIKKEDFDRMIAYGLSPINVSVHTTNPELRVALLKNPSAGKIMEDMKRLADAGIVMNAQIVLLPNVNDGEELKRTLRDLASLMPQVASVAMVPVGLSKYRDHLPKLSPYTKEEARDVIAIAESFAEEMRKICGRRWVYASDEFYLIAEKNLPEADFYDGYPQYENGVGLMRSFYEEFKEALDRADGAYHSKITLATGEYAGPLFEELAAMIHEKFPGIQCDVVPIKNDFFGDTVKVAGLLTAKDVVRQLKGKIHDAIMLPMSMFRSDRAITLDDVTVEALERELGAKIITVSNNGAEFLEKCLEVRPVE